MPSDKDLLNEAARLEQIYDAKEGLAEDIVELAKAHTAEVLADAMRVVEMAEKALMSCVATCDDDRYARHYALAAIAKLKEGR